MAATRRPSRSLDKAVKAVTTEGILLVFPKDNALNPNALWHMLHPHRLMKWDWDENGDNRVARLWHLRSELSSSSQVVYTKWYKGRATLFSREMFKGLLAVRLFQGKFKGASPLELRKLEVQLSATARELLAILQDSSPLSTKKLKELAVLKGRDNERRWTKAMTELWQDGWIVGFGEVDDGAFPSLAVGATSLLFEDLWREAMKLSLDDAATIFEEGLDLRSYFWRELLKRKPFPIF